MKNKRFILTIIFFAFSIIVCSVLAGINSSALAFSSSPNSTSGTPPAVLSQNQNDSNDSQTKTIVIATTNIYNQKLISQNGNTLKIGFDLSNRENIQPGVKYSVSVLKAGDDSEKWKKTVIDEKVYDEKLSLLPNQNLYREIEYSAPDYLSGNFEVWLNSKNDKGLLLALAKIGDINFSGNGQFIEIQENSCSLAIQGEINDKKYSIYQGVDFSVKEKAFLSCQVKNNFTKDINFTPNFAVYYRDIFGEKITEIEQVAVSIASGEERVLMLEVPKVEKPQAYDSLLSFSDIQGKTISNRIKIHYVIQGLSATFENFLLDKDYYRKGDIAKLTVLWENSSDSFQNARLRRVENDKKTMSIGIFDGEGNICSKSFSAEIGNNQPEPKTFEVAIKSECINPQVKATIKDKDGNTLDEANYSIETKNVQDLGNDKMTALVKKFIYVLIVVPIILVVILIFLRRKNKSFLTGIFILICIFGIFGIKESAFADTLRTYELGNPGNQRYDYTVWLSNGSTNTNQFNPNGLMRAHVSGSYIGMCNNTASSQTVSVQFNTNDENSWRVIINRAGLTGGGSFEFYADYSAPSQIKNGYQAYFFGSVYWNGDWAYSGIGTAYINYNVGCRQPSDYAYWISNNTVSPGEKFTAVCNYGAYTNAIGFSTGAASSCNWVGWGSGYPGAIFECTAKNNPGTYDANCKLYNIDPDHYCGRSDSTGSITVRCVPDNSCIWNTCRNKKCNDGCGNLLDGQKDCSSHAVGNEVCNNFSYGGDCDGGPCYRKCDAWCTVPGAKCNSGNWTSSCAGNWYDNKGWIYKVECCKDADCGGGGSTCNLSNHKCTPAVSIKASPNPVKYDAASTLTWTTKRALWCWASGGDWNTSASDYPWKANAGGSESTGNLTSAKTYTIQCSNDAGSSVPRSVTVNVKNPVYYTLSVDVDPPFSGYVNSSDGKIGNCSNACTADYIKGSNESVTLTAYNNAGYKFSNWTGEGNVVPGFPSKRSFIMNGDKAVTANFTGVGACNPTACDDTKYKSRRQNTCKDDMFQDDCGSYTCQCTQEDCKDCTSWMEVGN
jgi:uncharacterized protein (UPF0333 family)